MRGRVAQLLKINFVLEDFVIKFNAENCWINFSPRPERVQRASKRPTHILHFSFSVWYAALHISSVIRTESLLYARSASTTWFDSRRSVSFFSSSRRREDCANVNATQTTCFSTCKTPDGFSRLQCSLPRCELCAHSYARTHAHIGIVGNRKHKRKQCNNYHKIQNINGSTLRKHFGLMVFCCAK